MDHNSINHEYLDSLGKNLAWHCSVRGMLDRPSKPILYAEPLWQSSVSGRSVPLYLLGYVVQRQQTIDPSLPVWNTSHLHTHRPVLWGNKGRFTSLGWTCVLSKLQWPWSQSWWEWSWMLNLWGLKPLRVPAPNQYLRRPSNGEGRRPWPNWQSLSWLCSWD